MFLSIQYSILLQLCYGKLAACLLLFTACIESIFQNAYRFHAELPEGNLLISYFNDGA